MFGSHGKGTGPRVSHCRLITYWPARSIFISGAEEIRDAHRPPSVSLRCESASRGQKFSKSKNFQLFFKTGFVHVSGLWDNFKRKKFFRISDQSESRYRDEIRNRQKLPFTCNQRRRTLPVRITWKGDWTSGVSLRCESASRGQKFSKSKKFSTFFSKHVCSTFQDSGIILSGKNFSEFQTNPSPGIVMRFERQKLPLTCNQRRRTLQLFGSHGKGTGPRVSHCDARVPVEVKNFQSQKNFQLFFQNMFAPRFRTLG